MNAARQLYREIRSDLRGLLVLWFVSSALLGILSAVLHGEWQQGAGFALGWQPFALPLLPIMWIWGELASGGARQSLFLRMTGVAVAWALITALPVALLSQLLFAFAGVDFRLAP